MKTIFSWFRKWLNDGRRYKSRAASKVRLMCDECEEIEPLTVAYFGKMERKGWRPPAAARTVPVHDDRVVSGRPYAMQAAQFVCAPADEAG
jgi:hypothetical protein